MNHFSPEDLLLYIYNEMPAATKIQLEAALEKDWTLREKLAVLQASHKQLNTITQAPRTEAVLHILQYAARTEKVLPQ